jgi:trans-aconitate methyltransferase
VRSLCRDVLSRAGRGEGRLALDLGCGAGIETTAMVSEGWRVHAIDSAPGTLERVSHIAGDGDVTTAVADLAALTELPPSDLIYAGYSLPYVPPSRFPAVWKVIRAALRPGGWIAVNLMGDHDEWAGKEDETSFSATEARALFDGWEMVDFAEEDGRRPSYSGEKHWHFFDVIARAL